MIEEPYQILAGSESFGDSYGTLGVKIMVAGSNLPAHMESESIWLAANNAVETIREKIIAGIIQADPKAQEAAALERQNLLHVFYCREKTCAIYVEEIPNGYCNRSCCQHRPWFVVTTQVGRITIGWRKRVIEIDWNDTRGTQEANSLFPDEHVTKGTRSIHAWSLEKAKEYVAAIIDTATP